MTDTGSAADTRTKVSAALDPLAEAHPQAAASVREIQATMARGDAAGVRRACLQLADAISGLM